MPAQTLVIRIYMHKHLCTYREILSHLCITVNKCTRIFQCNIIFIFSLLPILYYFHTTCMLINVHSQTACCWAITPSFSPPRESSFVSELWLEESVSSVTQWLLIIVYFQEPPVIASKRLNTVHLTTVMITYTPLAVCSFLSPCCIIFLFIILPTTSLPVKWIPHSGMEIQIFSFYHPLPPAVS